MSYAPTLTTYTTYDPCPRVEVLFSSFASGTVKVDVYQLADGRTRLISGGVKAVVSGALSRIDFTIPPNIPVSYRAEMFDAAGLSLGFTDATTVTLPMAAGEMSVHNPLNPQGAVKVIAMGTAAESISRPVDGQTVFPLNRHVGVMVAGQRHGVQGLVMDCYTETLDDADRLQALLGGYIRVSVPVLCFRTGSRMRIPKPLFLGVLDMGEEAQTLAFGGAIIAQRITGDEVDPPTPALVVPLLTRADLNAAYATRAALNAAYLTRLDADRAYSLAGTA